jgi:hypothetical protein
MCDATGELSTARVHVKTQLMLCLVRCAPRFWLMVCVELERTRRTSAVRVRRSLRGHKFDREAPSLPESAMCPSHRLIDAGTHRPPRRVHE